MFKINDIIVNKASDGRLICKVIKKENGRVCVKVVYSECSLPIGETGSIEISEWTTLNRSVL